MTARSFERALHDSIALATLAEQSGVTREQARAVLAALADVPIREAVRMAKTAHADRERQKQRMARLGR